MATKRQHGRRLLARAIKGFDGSRTEFAAAIEMSVEQLRHIEAGRRQPTLPQSIQLEDTYEIPIRSWA